jgi:hypothetical protein
MSENKRIEKTTVSVNHGGKRHGAGRPSTGAMPTRTIRMTDDEYRLVKQFLMKLRSHP